MNLNYFFKEIKKRRKCVEIKILVKVYPLTKNGFQRRLPQRHRKCVL